MPERENSVLMSLQELRRLEEDRVRREQDAARAHVEAERRAKEEGERKAREDEEARRRAEEERLRKADEDRQSRIRQDQLRLEEAERMARVDADTKLQQERMRLEMHARAQSRGPMKAIVAVVVVLAGAGAGIGYYMNGQHKAELAAQQQKLRDIEAKAELDKKQAEMEFERKMVAIRRDMDDRLKLAKNDADKERIRNEARVAAEAAQEVKERKVKHVKNTGSSTAGGGPTEAKGPKGKRTISDNPLDGLNL